jgi:Rad3-related DNA helicase
MSMRNELATTLTQVIDALVERSAPGIVVTAAEVDFPLEVTAATRGKTIVFFASAPHTRWVAGVLPDVHLARLHVELADKSNGEA